MIAIDTETTGLDLHINDKPFAVSTCDDQGSIQFYQWNVDTETRTPKVLKSEKQELLLSIRGQELVFHNTKFDIKALHSIGIKPNWRHRSHDTGLMSHVFDSEIHSRKSIKGRLKPLATYYGLIVDDDEKELMDAVKSARFLAKKLNWNIAEKTTGNGHLKRDYWIPRQIAQLYFETKHKYKKSNTPFTTLDDEKASRWLNVLEAYAIQDAVRTITLASFFLPEISKDDRLTKCYLRERKLLPITFDMEQNGVTVKPETLKREQKRYAENKNVALKKLQRIAHDNTFNPDSSIQLPRLLFDDLGIKGLQKTASGKNWSTDKDNIKELLKIHERKKKSIQYKCLRALQDYKSSAKAEDYCEQYGLFTYKGVLYFNLNQVGTSTTRFSSSRPNSQNVSKGKENEDGTKKDFSLRSLFGPRKGRVWYCIDYSQLQLRIFAHLSGERSMIEAFEQGYDFHAFVASRIFNCHPDEVTELQRRIGKNVNFGFIFGASPKKIEQTAGKKGLWEIVIKQFPNAHAYMQKRIKEVYSTKRIFTPFGYQLYLPYVDGRIKAYASVNYEVQGCEGDIVKNAMIDIHQNLSELQEDGFTGFMSLQVHDELVFDFPSKDTKKFSHNRILTDICTIMESKGTELNMVTPVDVKRTNTSWDKCKDYKLCL